MIMTFPMCIQTAFHCFVLLWKMGQFKLSATGKEKLDMKNFKSKKEVD